VRSAVPLRASQQSTASRASGSTTTVWRPGHHQPCMVLAAKVATSQPASNGSARALNPRGGQIALSRRSQ